MMAKIDRRRFSRMMTVAALMPGAWPAWAQVKGLELVAPSNPGGGYDQLARTV